MKRSSSGLGLGIGLLFLLGIPGVAAELQTIWQIGLPDNSNAEFALAPKGYNAFRSDGFFVIGSSDAKTDWPYVHPGPGDGWAGGRQHTFTILFGLKAVPAEGSFRLVLDLLDTHSSSPPRLRVSVNGHRFEKELPRGAGDASISGQPEQGRKAVWEIPLPASVLLPSENEITVTTLSGSWFLYDCVRLEGTVALEMAPIPSRTMFLGVRLPPVWLKDGKGAAQPVDLMLRHIGAEAEGTLNIGGLEPRPVHMKNGEQTLQLKLPASEQPHTVSLSLAVAGQVLASTNLSLRPPPIRQLWLLPHSHVDIGYTHRQDEVIGVQIGNLEKAMQLAQASSTNSPGMRFKWNPEAVWTLDHFLQQATPEQRSTFINAVRAGDVGVDALYGNMLTGLCRPEELAQSVSFGARLSALTGRPVISASICDVPGYTWGFVPIMAQAGVKYFAIGPNFGDRVGTIHIWDNKPFYWKAQDGRDRVMCWVVDNYHFLGDVEQNVVAQVERLQRSGFPYDTTFLFWVGQWPNGGVDNAPPDEKLTEKVVAWNKKYAAPRVVIGLVGEFFREFERRHGSQLPEFSGDLTPYWEDGAGSTARETALNRSSGDRLSQASALFAMRDRAAYPAERFAAAWKNVLLYSEHTWGAWCSISKPDDPFTLDQWRVKRGFALAADKQAGELLASALPTAESGISAVDVFNTTQWPRTDLAVIPTNLAGAQITCVADEHGRLLPSQRLSSGELAFLAKDVPPFGVKRYRLSTASCPTEGKAFAKGNVLESKKLRVEVDPTSGAVKSLRAAGLEHDFVDPKAPVGLNDYRYLLGTNAQSAMSNGQVNISVLESGPLVASLRLQSEAPGCNRLVREVRIIDDLPHVEFVDHVDRKSVREKDGVHFGFGCNVPNGMIRMETPWAVVRPNIDQLPGSCRNWFTVQRWVDISNPNLGMTWASLDAPLMEIGGLTANLLGSVDFKEWMTNALDSQTIYSWAQNNHWHTNYKIDQPGITTFRYILRPHRRGYSAAESARFGVETSRPLVVAAAKEQSPVPPSLLKLSSADVLLETLKVSDDGRALVMRLFGVSGKDESITVSWHGVKISSMWLCNLVETPLIKVEHRIHVPAYDVVTVRAELE